MSLINSHYDMKYYWVEFSESEIANFVFHKYCPICNANEGFEKALKLGCLTWRFTLDISVCKNCYSFTYENPPSKDFFDKYYSKKWMKNSSEHKNLFQKNFMPKKNDLSEILNNLGISKKSKILDFGCGTGGGLIGIQEKGYNNIFGLELSEHRAKISDFFFPKKIFKQHYSEFDPKKKFDVICSNSVMEHIPIPYDAFKWQVKSLKKDGIIIMSVPNSEKESKFMQTFFLPHLHSVSYKGLICLAKKFKLKVKLHKSKNDNMKAIFFKGKPNVNLNKNVIFRIDTKNLNKNGYKNAVKNIQSFWNVSNNETKVHLLRYKELFSKLFKNDKSFLKGKGLRWLILKKVLYANLLLTKLLGHRLSSILRYIFTKLFGTNFFDVSYIEFKNSNKNSKNKINYLYFKKNKVKLMFK